MKHKQALSEKHPAVQTGSSAATIAKMGKDGNVTTEILARICEALDCNLEQIALATRQSCKNEDKPQRA
ncbi:hypothetical protein BKH15_10530 [Actinomyces oris]|uniref:HTH cro/C1-type domain-containing protein n=1 Tax=Actinomyces oris TaxID=544580 RepID=A0A1Q8X4H0_9ACTO|nr:hypothetical protein BKH15_10530 [Actinomyces oris]